jgi:hypothetical protein
LVAAAVAVLVKAQAAAEAEPTGVADLELEQLPLHDDLLDE